MATRLPTLDHALLVGQGRSGTNFLLALLDRSPRTHCRNEPDQLAGSALAALGEFRFFVDDLPRLAALYDARFREAALCVGPRDHHARVEKDWLRPGLGGPGYFYLRQRYLLLERVLRRRHPMDGRELRYPSWMVERDRLERSLHVFKLNAAVGLAGWALEHRPEARVLHLVRHPGGFLRSWLERWVRREDERERERSTRAGVERLRGLARREPRWAALLGDVDALGRAEGELWWWRWVNEALHEAGRGRRGYRLVLYEELSARAVEVGRAVFGCCSLPWDRELEQRVLGLARGSEAIARAWKDELEPESVALVERVLDGSPMAGWWPEERTRDAA